MINPSYGEEREREEAWCKSLLGFASTCHPCILVEEAIQREREREARADDDATVTVGKLPSYDESGWRR